MKTYLKPNIKVKDIQIQSCMMNNSITEGTVDNNTRVGVGNSFSNGHRGSWGNLWDDEE